VALHTGKFGVPLHRPCSVSQPLLQTQTSFEPGFKVLPRSGPLILRRLTCSTPDKVLSLTKEWTTAVPAPATPSPWTIEVKDSGLNNEAGVVTCSGLLMRSCYRPPKRCNQYFAGHETADFLRGWRRVTHQSRPLLSLKGIYRAINEN
jgi:hypothetical protein